MWLPGILSLSQFQSIESTMLSIMPYFSNGKKHLSPNNAVDMLRQKVDANDLIFCLMLSSNNENNFVSKLQNLADSWSLPDFKKALRISKTLTTLDANKMIIPAIDKAVSSSPLSTSQTRSIIASQRLGKIEPVSLGALRSNVTSFAKKQESLINEALDSAKKLGNSFVKVDFFFGLASDLRKDIPNENHIFTLLTGFVGNDIHKLLKLIEIPIEVINE